MSRRRTAPLEPLRQDVFGRTLCRYCQEEPVHAPYRAFCSFHCCREFRIRRYPEVAKEEYIKAYGDHCVKCKKSEHILSAAWKIANDSLYCHALDHLLKPFPFFQLDHIRPVIDGGGECGLEGFRLLCRPCHGGITAQFNHGRAMRKRPEGPWQAAQRARNHYKVTL